VLPDASTGKGPDSLAEKQSRCQEGMARVFAIILRGKLSWLWIAVQISQGSVVIRLYGKCQEKRARRADHQLCFCLGSGSSSAKTVTNNLPILSVLCVVFFLNPFYTL
jgi:hypothetical protein